MAVRLVEQTDSVTLSGVTPGAMGLQLLDDGDAPAARVTLV